MRKRCTKCERDKPIERFYRKGKYIYSWCIDCHNSWIKSKQKPHVVLSLLLDDGRELLRELEREFYPSPSMRALRNELTRAVSKRLKKLDESPPVTEDAPQDQGAETRSA